MYTCGCHIYVGAAAMGVQVSWRKVWDPLELQFWVAVSCPVRVLGECVLNC